jgi:hypothetical protein
LALSSQSQEVVLYTAYEVLTFMQGERWQLLCKLAEQEQDPDKLLELAAAIERILGEKQERLEQQRSSSKEAGTSA